MAVNKLDPKIIFASEAPAQDTPAVFNNRTLGWGESRKNGGRPTIKQMNALQQDTELKILWLNENSVTPFDATIDYPVNAVTIKDGQFKIFNGTSWNLFLDKSSVGLNNVDNTSDLNKPISAAVKAKLDYIDNNGAALPYKDGIAYEENAVVVKDGVLQQWNGGEWVEFLNDFANKDEVKRGIANRYDPLLTYNSGERVVLDNGDIVKSTIDGNTNDPNVDMVGWENFGKDVKDIKYANYRDIREFGGVVDKTTDNTTLIRDVVQNLLGSDEVLYIPAGTKWNYTSIYSYMSDYQTIIDDSGRDEARNLWQATRVTWRKTNANTGATNGNTETISGDYHPAYCVDTYGTVNTASARASTVYRLGGSSKWQIGLDFTTAAWQFGIAQYGAQVDGTKSISVGHQDGTVAGKVGFNHGLNNTSMMYTFAKASYIDPATVFNTQYIQGASDTSDFQTYYRYGTTTAYREDIKVDGTHQVITKNSRRITTTADCVRYGTRKNVKALTASATLTVDETDSYVSNVSASSVVFVALPKATVGLTYEISVDAAFNMRVIPNAADNFVGLAAGKYKESTTVGSRLKLVAVTANIWSFEQIGTWTNQA